MAKVVLRITSLATLTILSIAIDTYKYRSERNVMITLMGARQPSRSSGNLQSCMVFTKSDILHLGSQRLALSSEYLSLLVQVPLSLPQDVCSCLSVGKSLSVSKLCICHLAVPQSLTNSTQDLA